LEDRCGHSIVYDISHLSQEAQLFVLHLKLFKNMLYREVEFERNCSESPVEGTDIILLEESHRFLSVDESRQDLGDLALLDAVRTSRKRGIRFIISSQIISGIPNQALGNINTRIVGRIVDGTSLWQLAQITGWDKNQIDFVRQLPPRHFIVQTANMPEGIVVRVPELKE